MAVPKRKTSKSRKGMRRSHHRVELPAMVPCPKCSTVKLRHTVCSECGYYRGRPLFVVEDF